MTTETYQVTVAYGQQYAGAYVRLYASKLTGPPAVIPFSVINSEKWALQSDGLILMKDGFLDSQGKITVQWNDDSEHESGRLQAAVRLVDGWVLSNPISYGGPPAEPTTLELLQALGNITALWMPGVENVKNVDNDPAEQGDYVYGVTNQAQDEYHLQGWTPNDGCAYGEAREVYSSTADGNFTSGDTTIDVVDASGFSAGDFIINRSTGEIIQIDSILANTLTVVRAYTHYKGQSITSGDVLARLRVGDQPYWLPSGNGSATGGLALETDIDINAGTSQLLADKQYSMFALTLLCNSDVTSSTGYSNPDIFGQDNYTNGRPYLSIRDTSGGLAYFAGGSTGALSQVSAPYDHANPVVMSGRHKSTSIGGSGHLVGVDGSFGTPVSSGNSGSAYSSKFLLGYTASGTLYNGPISIVALYDEYLADDDALAVVNILRSWAGLAEA